MPLEPALYLVATPIGNLRDITLRALDVLAKADLVLAEDTRVTGKLMSAYGIKARLQRYDDHMGAAVRPQILARLAEGARVALLTGLAGAGLPTDRFLFAGFPPPKSAARRTFLEELKPVRATLVFFEGASRLGDSLKDMAAVLGPRPAAVARELTKLYETVVRGSLEELAANPALQAPKGE